MNFKQILEIIEKNLYLLPPYYERIYEIYIDDDYMDFAYKNEDYNLKCGYINHKNNKKLQFSKKYSWIYKNLKELNVMDIICIFCFDSVCKYKKNCTFNTGVNARGNNNLLDLVIFPYRYYDKERSIQIRKYILNKFIKQHIKLSNDFIN